MQYSDNVLFRYYKTPRASCFHLNTSGGFASNLSPRLKGGEKKLSGNSFSTDGGLILQSIFICIFSNMAIFIEKYNLIISHLIFPIPQHSLPKQPVFGFNIRTGHR